MAIDAPSKFSSKFFVLIFVAILAGILIAFIYFVRTASSTLPQEQEIITSAEAARLIETGAIERILIQEARDIFLYRAGEERPLYTKLSEGEVFTDTMLGLDITPDQFPPLTVELE